MDETSSFVMVFSSWDLRSMGDVRSSGRFSGQTNNMTFLAWLKGQRHRKDAVGKLAREVHAEWGRDWKEVGASFHLGGQNWPRTLHYLRRYLSSSTLEYLHPDGEYPPPVSKKALGGLDKAWSEWTDASDMPGPSKNQG